MKICILPIENDDNIITFPILHLSISDNKSNYQVQLLFHIVSTTKYFLLEPVCATAFSVPSKTISRIEETEVSQKRFKNGNMKLKVKQKSTQFFLILILGYEEKNRCKNYKKTAIGE